MPETTAKKRGGRRPGAGGAREGAGRKSKGLLPRTETLCIRVEVDIADWVKSNGGSELHYSLLRKAFIEGHIA